MHLRGSIRASEEMHEGSRTQTEGTQIVAIQINRIPSANAGIQGAGYQFPSVGDVAKRALAFVVDHQRRRAEQRVRPFLARQSDEALAELGYTPAEIAEIRRPPVRRSKATA